MRFLWTTLNVENMKDSYNFYTKAVGLTEERKLEYQNGMEIIFLGKDGTQIELIYNPNNSVEKMGKEISIGFQVESVDEKIQELDRMGIKVFDGPKEPNPKIKFFYVLDPNGLKVQFAELR